MVIVLYMYHLSIPAGGKSAIMTGIVVALGGKARSTERGSSLKQFIRTGASNSKVLVHLRNRGHEAYKPEEYGDTIICERVIKEDGTTAYKIKSENGEYWGFTPCIEGPIQVKCRKVDFQ